MIGINDNGAQLKIEMLGDFSITYGETLITEHVRRTSKTWRLLQYLIAHRHKFLSQEELFEVFCSEKLMEDPGSALRMLVYRARSALAKGGIPFADDLIVSKKGGYTWNNEIHCTIDTEEFEALCRKADARQENDKRLKMLLKAARLYRGDFLPDSSGDMWVMPLSRWYRSLYLKCTHEALSLLTVKGRNAEAEELCVNAMRIDPFDEQTLGYYIRSLLSQSKNTEALDAYRSMESMFYDILGVQVSDDLRALCDRVNQAAIAGEAKLELVLKEWIAGADFPGAYYCDLGVFKALYQVESRSASRSGRTAYMVSFETKHEPGKKNGDVMSQLGKMIPTKLRKGDLFTRASPSQYMLMLTSLSYEDCKSLINRILSALSSKYLPKIVGTSIKPIEPIM